MTDIITKDVESIKRLQEASVTGGDSNTNAGVGYDVFYRYAKAGQLAPNWWSKRRDEYLSRFGKETNYFAAAVYKFITKLISVTPRVEARDPNVSAHRDLANMYQSVLIEGSDYGHGWTSLMFKGLQDYCMLDNGMFWEVLGDGPKDGAIRGMPLGLAPLDSLRCNRTGDFEYPVNYYHDGKKYKLHWTRVIALSSMPTSIASMNGVGFCWLSRAIDIAQNLLDILVYKEEKLGSRPIRQILIGKGISTNQIGEAFRMVENSLDNQGLNNYAKSAVIGSLTNTEIGIDQIDLASIPDGFDEQTSVELGMYVIALAGGIPPRDLWPASTVGATKADAMYQHIGGSAGYEIILKQIATALGGPEDTDRHLFGKFLPASLKLVFDFVDDEQDARVADISDKRSQTRERDLTDGVIDVRTARQTMLSDGELDEAQFDRLELASGRLPNGHPVESLFYISDPLIQDMLVLSVGDPLDVEANRGEAEFIIQQIDQRILEARIEALNSGRAKRQQAALEVIAALEKLKKMYQEIDDGQEEIIEAETDTIEQMSDGDDEIKAKTFKPPQSAQNNAKKVLRWREEHPDEIRGMTSVGWARARQLASGKPLSLDDIREIAQFNRHRENAKVDPKFKNEPWKDRGYVAWLGWGGDSMINYAMRISEANKEKNHFLNRKLEYNKKQVDGEDLPPEIDEYEQELIDLIEQANNDEITEEEFENQVKEITTAIIVALFLLSTGEDTQDDLDSEQQDRLDEELGVAIAAIPGLSRDVFNGNYLPEDEGGRGWNTAARAVLWATFAASVYELAKLYNRRLEDRRMIWNITAGKDNCTDCLRLNGQIHTREEWLTSGWWPKSRGLECNGYNCGCSLTEVRATRSQGSF